MRDLLPDGVFTMIQKQFRRAEMTPIDFDNNKADEDSLTGAFGTRLGDAVRGFVDGYVWQTKVVKIRGRGPHAPEKPLGADALIEIEVRGPRGVIVGQKGLLAQAKKEWSGADPLLAGQIENMEAHVGNGSIVLDYERDGVRAARGTAALEAKGNARQLPDGALRPAGVVLADDFLTCEIGHRGVYYDGSRERLLVSTPAGITHFRFKLGRTIKTVVEPWSPAKVRPILARPGR